MGPKKGGNPKAVAAKERKAEAANVKAAASAKAAEDAEWAAAGEGAKSKAQAKKEEQARQREEAAAKKAEAKRLAAEEEASLAKAAAKPAKAKAATPKVTSHQLQLEREARQRALQKEQEERKRDQKRTVSEQSYDALVAAPNTNRSDDDVIEARNVGEALSALSVGDGAEEDRHPEKRVKAAFEAFLDRELPALKQEKPGLKQSQYKDMLFKAWQKSPENPVNRARAQA